MNLKKTLLISFFCLIFSFANAAQWFEKEFYSQGLDHYVIGQSEWSESIQDSKRDATKDALLNYSTFTNLEVSSSYIESIVDDGSDLEFKTSQEGIIKNNSKIGKVYYQQSKTEKKTEEGWFSDDVTYRTIVQLKIHSNDVQTYDIETIAEEATELLLNQATRTNEVRDKEKRINELLKSLEAKEKNLNSMLQKLEKKDAEVSGLKDELRLQIRENRFKPIEKEKPVAVASNAPVKLNSSLYDYSKFSFDHAMYSSGGFSQLCKITNSVGDWQCTGRFKKGSAETGVKAKSIHVAGTQVCVLSTEDKVKCFRPVDKFDDWDEDGIIELPTINSEVVGISMGRTTAWGFSNVFGPFACAILKRNNSVQCWALQEGLELYTPSFKTDVVKIDSGWGHTCALMSDGKIDCWGVGGEEKLSHTTNAMAPVQAVQVSFSQPAVDLIVGHFSSCGIMRDGSVECFGQVGEIHRKTYSGSVLNKGDYRVPATVTDVAQLSVGAYSACAVSHTDKITCWGDNRVKINHEVKIGSFPEGKILAAANTTCVYSEHNSSNSSCWYYRSNRYPRVSEEFLQK